MHKTGVTLSAAEARRLAIASQGFGERPAKVTLAHLRKLAARVHAFQIDSVNVLVRAHYVPAFARLGPYRMDLLDTLVYEKRELFEYWGHAACLLPVSLYPLIRYRMRKHAEVTQEYMRHQRGAAMARAYAEVAERGALTAGELTEQGTRAKGWWGWAGSANGKAILEHLYDAGVLAIAGRRGFERRYDLAERVIPRHALEAPVPPREEAMKQLICLAAQACGVGTANDLINYFYVDGWHDRLRPGPVWDWIGDDGPRRTKSIVRGLVAELAEEGRLLPVEVEGWKQRAFLHPQARVPRRVEARGLMTPFDSLVWERDRIARSFGMEYSIELYTPAPKRIYGYYVCPFVLGDTLVARCDLKADRARRVLMVPGAFLEPRQQATHQATRVAAALAEELEEMRRWLDLDRVEIGRRGDLAAGLKRCVAKRTK
jgi:uncharacterized protein YcaQ